MTRQQGNLRANLPNDLQSELFEEIVRSSTVRIERIISRGHTSPETGWYDQEENEWVMVLQGKAIVAFADGQQCVLSADEYINIPAHVLHRVAWSDPQEVTVWLAVFYA